MICNRCVKETIWISKSISGIRYFKCLKHAREWVKFPFQSMLFRESQFECIKAIKKYLQDHPEEGLEI